MSQQLPQPYWQRSFGGYGDDYSAGLIRTYDKGFVLVGYSYQSINGDIDTANLSFDYYAWVVKLDSVRNIVWQRKIRRVQPIASQVATRQVIQTKDSGIVVIGSGANDLAPQFAIKYSKNGELLWKYEPPANGRVLNFSQVLENPDGSLVIAGSKTLFLGNDPTRGWLLCLNANGSFNWEKLYQGLNGDMHFSTIDTSFGGGYIVGGVYDTLGGNILLAKIAPDRTMTWYKSYGGHGYEIVNDIISLPDNTYMVSSSTTSNDGDVSGNHCIGSFCPEDAWLLKIDQSGNILNNAIYGDFDTDKGLKLIRYDNGVLMVGYSNSRLNSFSTNRGGYDVWTTQLDYNLNRVSAYGFYGGPGNDNGLDVVIDSSEGEIYPVILATTEGGAGSQVEGFHESQFSLNEKDSWLFKLDRFNTIRGYAFYDYNRDGIKSATEPYFKRGVFTTASSQDTLNSYNADGTFQFRVLHNNYTTKLTINDTAYSITPSFDVSAFPNYFNTDSLVFAVQLKPGFSDVSIAAYALASARPGQEVIYEAMVTNRTGDTARNKQVYLLKDPNLSYLSASPAPLRVNADSVIWQYSILRPSDTIQYSVRLKTGIPPQVQLNDTLKSYFNAPLANDADTTNNTALILQTIRGSFDPNDKNEMHNGKLQAPKAMDGEYLTYVIRFQNTGNDVAFNIVIKDMLDPQLNPATLEIVKTSHPYSFKMNKRQLQWTFQNIYLPDSTANEPGSHGFIIYRIKTNKNIVPNSFVNNNAAIYFDYNLPVITGTAKTQLLSSVTSTPGTSSVQTKFLRLFPNPATGKVLISYSGNTPVEAMIEVFNLTGILIKRIPSQLFVSMAPIEVETGNLANGVYYFRINGKKINETHTVMIAQ